MKSRIAAAFACLAFSGAAFAAAGSRLNFNPDWKFVKADPPGAADPAFDDRSWSAVSLPHTFNDTDTFDDWSIPNHVGEMNQWSGRTWYRKTFTAPEAWKGKKVFIEFEAVRQIAEVYVNGKLLGASKTGFLPFGFDLTPHLHPGAKNVIAVMADNRFTLETEMAKIIKTDLPWNSPHWHPAHGGIYRNVYLHVTDPLHISLPLYSFLQTAGPYAYATDVKPESARIEIEIPVENARPSDASVQFVVTILGPDGRPVLTLQEKGQLTANASADVRLSGILPSPQHWEPAHPNLYRVLCSLRVANKEVDAREFPLGIRTARWDVASGLFLNGHPEKLRGWGQKPTDEWPGLGAAQPDWLHFFTLQLMKDAGANFVRWGHCAGAPAMLDAADRLGLITEQPGVDGEGDAQGDAWTLRAAAFRDMIVYYRNHPSILIWEGGNQKVSREHAKELRGYMQQYDPGGGRAYAHRRADEITAEFMDVGIGTEGGREIARLPVVEGEYNREESPRRVWDNASPPNFGYPEGKGQTYQLTSEQYAVNQITQFKKIAPANHAGGANWIFSDSTSGGRVSTEVARAGGEVDAVRLPKEAWYVMKVLYRGDPQVHLIGHWSYPAGTKKTVYAASNAEDVELFLNGRSLGHGKVSDRYLFTFPDIVWEPGEIKVVATTAGKVVATGAKHTVGPPVALRMTAITGPGGLFADGSDVALIDVEAIDAKGDRCPTLQQRVDFDLTGPGVWRGGYNSGKLQSINNTFLDLEAGVNRVAVRATRNAGVITVKVRGEGLRPASIAIPAKAFAAPNGISTTLPALPAARIAAPVTGSGSAGLVSSAAPAGKYVTSFSYSGPARDVQIASLAKNDAKAYVDSNAVISKLPGILNGADYVRAAQSDRLYSAVDLMEVAVKPGTVVWVAFDSRLSPPAWLTGSFEAADLSLNIGGHPMKLFRHRTGAAESLTLGSNSETAAGQDSNMYVVFAGPQ
jgi:beta-galactosidase